MVCFAKCLPQLFQNKTGISSLLNNFKIIILILIIVSQANSNSEHAGSTACGVRLFHWKGLLLQVVDIVPHHLL